MASNRDVAYKPVTMDTQFEVEDTRGERAYWKQLRKTSNIVIFIIICLVVAAIIAIIILLSTGPRDEPFEYEMIPTNITADLHVEEYPDNATIEIDIENSIDKLYRESIFTDFYSRTIVMKVTRGTEPEMSVLLIFSDLGDHIGSRSGGGDEPTDVVDFFLIALSNNSIEGFGVSRWRLEQS